MSRAKARAGAAKSIQSHAADRRGHALGDVREHHAHPDDIWIVKRQRLLIRARDPRDPARHRLDCATARREQQGGIGSGQVVRGHAKVFRGHPGLHGQANAGL